MKPAISATAVFTTCLAVMTLYVTFSLWQHLRVASAGEITEVVERVANNYSDNKERQVIHRCMSEALTSTDSPMLKENDGKASKKVFIQAESLCSEVVQKYRLEKFMKTLESADKGG